MSQVTRILDTIMPLDSVEHLSNAEIYSMRQDSFDELYQRCCKVLPNMLYTDFVQHASEPYWIDLWQAAMLGVLRAVESWDHNGGSSITTWAYKLAKQEVLKELAGYLQWDYSMISADFIDEIDDDDMAMILSDTAYGDQSAGERSLEWQAEFHLAKQRLPAEYAFVLELILEGYSQREIASFGDVSQATVSRIVAEIQHMLQRNNNIS